MPLFSCFSPFGNLEFSSRPSVCQRVYESMAASLGGQYDLTVGGHNEATLYARARELSRGIQAQRRAGNNANPLKCVELLPLQETGYGLVPNERDGVLARQQALAARMLLSRGARRESIESQLRALLGSNFIELRGPAAGEVVTWPTSPSAGPGTFLRPDGALPPKFFTFLSPVATTGTAVTVYYQQLDPSQTQSPLAAGDVMVAQLEVLGLAEKVTVASVGTDSTGAYFTATFQSSHDLGCTGIVGSVPVWLSTQRVTLVVVAATAALDAETHRKIDDIMARCERGVSQWAVVQPSSPGATTAGPFTLNVSPLGIVPIGTLTL